MGNPGYRTKSVLSPAADLRGIAQSNQFLRALINASPVAIVALDRQGCVTMWSPAAERLLGWTEEEALGQFLPSIPDDKIAEFLKHLGAVFAGGGYAGKEIVRQRKDGTRIPLSLWTTGLRDDSGQVIYCVSLFADRTEKEEAERALADSEQRYRQIVETANEGIWLVDSEYRTLFMNRRGAEMFGSTPEDMLGQTVFEFMHEEDREGKKRARQRRIAGIKEEMEERYRKKDGSDLWARVSAAPIIDGAGRFAGSLAMLTDITETRRAQQAAQEGEQRFRALADAIPQMAWISKGDGRLEYVNQRWVDYCGAPAGDWLRYFRWTAVLHPDDAAAAKKQWQDALQAGECPDVVYRLKRADGMYRWHVAKAVAVRDSSGAIQRWFGTCTDIHDLKSAQNALMESEKLATVGRVSASIAHEINNPLAATANLLYLISSNQGLPPDVRKYAEMAQAEVGRIAHITKQTLAFYRGGGVARQVHLPELLEGILSVHAPHIAAKSINVSKRFAPTGDVVVVEPEIRQVVSNLVANSIDALAHAGRFFLRLAKFSRDYGPSVKLTIADTGSGIAPEDLTRVFEPFFTTKPKTGTGLGLWVTRRLVEANEGTIRIRSRKDHGTVVCVFLPVRSAEGSTERSSQSADSTH